MIRLAHVLSATAALAVALAAAPAFATNYNFTAASGSSTPFTIAPATFSSPSDPGAFTFGPNAGLFTNLGSTVLSSAGVVATLNVAFSTPQKTISFDFALNDFFGAGGGDTLTVTTNTGLSSTFTASLVGSDFFPEGTAGLASNTAFSTVTISSAYALDIADLTSNTTVPEPASMSVLGLGLVGLAAVARRRA